MGEGYFVFTKRLTFALYKLYSLNWIGIPGWHNYQRIGEITDKVFRKGLEQLGN
ncbi:hypothetical protein UF75_4340 [Desulfosporosinus sp. I2]|nr:hypothetical protein UF75_4340 [Desulfosporosinus sp. I2]